ncbi:MAG: RNA polymerase sigma factor [Planctomycetes bacterium]|nr:RNA polymerase sigma factor [Planctomycetota bacterium]
MTEASIESTFLAMARFEPTLRILVRALVDEGSVDDILQQTWLRLWRRPPRERRATGAWLSRVATRLALSHLRSVSRRRRHEEALSGRETEPSTAELVERLQLQRAVSQAVTELAEPYRSVLIMRYFRQLSTAEIAAQSGATEAAVRQRIHRGLQRMRERLAADIGPDWRRVPAVIALLQPRLQPPLIAGSVPATLTMTLKKTQIAAAFVALACAVTGIGLAWSSTRTSGPELGASPDIHDAASASHPDAVEPGPIAPTRIPLANAADAPAAPWRCEVVDTAGLRVADVAVGVRGPGGLEVLAIADAHGVALVAAPMPTGELDVAPPWTVLSRGDNTAQPGAGGSILIVAPARALTLLTVDAAGFPLSGTEASVRCLGLVDYPRSLDDAVPANLPVSIATTDGRHSWARVPIAATRVTVRKPGYLPHAFSLHRDTAAEIRVQLQRLDDDSRAITGFVTDGRGLPMRGATVGFGALAVTADDYGGYEIRLGPGREIAPETDLFAVAPGWFPAVASGFGARLAAEPAAVLHRDLHLERAALSISGRVLDAAGNAQAGVDVYPWELANLTDRESAEDLAAPRDRAPLSLFGNELRAYDTTDEHGAFVVAGLDRRRYRLRLCEPELGWVWTTPELLGGSAGVDIRLPVDLIGPVSGQVVGRDGRPVAGVEIAAMVDVHSRDGATVAAAVPATARTAADGRFAFPMFPRYGTTLIASGVEWIDAKCRIDPARSTVGLVLELPARCHVRVRLLDESLRDAHVMFRDGAGSVVPIHRYRASRLTAVSTVYQLHDGKSEVLSVSEDARLLVVMQGGRDRYECGIALRPGRVNEVIE